MTLKQKSGILPFLKEVKASVDSLLFNGFGLLNILSFCKGKLPPMKLNSLTARIALGFALLTPAFLAPTAFAQAPAPACATGIPPADYVKLEVPAADSVAQKMNKDVIIEFFSYACIHCAHLYPSLVAAEAKDPKMDAQIVYIPAAFRPDWEQAGKLYYALVNQKLDSKENHAKVFEAAHKDFKTMFMDEKVLTTFLNKTLGEEKAKAVLADMKSFSVNSQIAKAKTTAQKYKVDATPIFVVDKVKGEQFRVDGATSGTLDKLLATVGKFAAIDCK